MNAAPGNLAKRAQVRQTMLQYAAVRAQRIVFRFVIGSMLIPPRPLTSQLDIERAAHDDIVMVDAIDGPGVAMECPAAEKTILWMQYALKTWPKALIERQVESSMLQSTTSKLESEIQVLRDQHAIMSQSIGGRIGG